MASPEPLKEGRVRMEAQLAVSAGTWTLTWCCALAVTRSCAFRSSGDFSKPWYAWNWGGALGILVLFWNLQQWLLDPKTHRAASRVAAIQSHFGESRLFKFEILCVFILWAVQVPGRRSLGSHRGSWLFLYSEGNTVVCGTGDWT